MPFVHGHARDIGWVMSHRRRPNRAEQGQLPLLPPGPMPAELGPAQDGPMEPGAAEPGAAESGAAEIGAVETEPTVPAPRSSPENGPARS